MVGDVVVSDAPSVTTQLPKSERKAVAAPSIRMLSCARTGGGCWVSVEAQTKGDGASTHALEVAVHDPCLVQVRQC